MLAEQDDDRASARRAILFRSDPCERMTTNMFPDFRQAQKRRSL
jgi:hypothetical protein